MAAPLREKGIHETNESVRDFEQVKKPKYHFAEQEDQVEQFDEDFQFKTCDLTKALSTSAAERSEFAQELGTALKEIGFAILVGNPIPLSLYEEADAKVQEIFTKFSLEEKKKFTAARFGSVNQGYFPIKETSDLHPDLVEGWVFCRRAFDVPNRLGHAEAAAFDPQAFWPDASYEQFFRQLVIEHEKLVLPLMQSILQFLELDVHLFDQKLSQTNVGLRLNYYPPVSKEDAESGAGRLLGHEDVTVFTILPAPKIEGLQVLNRKNNKWIRLLAPPGSIILNSGDYLQRLTNDVIPSTTHRVSKPRDKSLATLPRTSFPLNVYLWEDELMEVLLPQPKYPPIKALHFHTSITAKYYGGKTYIVNDQQTDQ